MSADPRVEGSELNGEVVLSLRDVSLTFRRRQGLFGSYSQTALSGINLDLHRGETLGIIGRNGSGKSTLLRVMAGILRPTAGRVNVAPDLSRAVLSLGLGFRNDLTGRDNALLSAILQGCTRRDAEANLEAINEFAELGDAFEHPVSTYSSGMRARLGFSTSLISHVDVLFIDEVLAVGDAAFRKKASEALKGRIRGDQTVVLVTHNLGEVEALCDRVVWIDLARAKRSGTPSEITKSYRDPHLDHAS